MSKKVSFNQDIPETKNKVRQLIKRYTEQTKTYEFLVKFEVKVD